MDELDWNRMRSGDSRALNPEHQDVFDAVAALRAENARLRIGYAEAIDDILSWGAYASEYFQEKHDLEGTVEQHRKVLAGAVNEICEFHGVTCDGGCDYRHERLSDPT